MKISFQFTPWTQPVDEFAEVVAPEHQSIAFFCNPDFINAEISCLLYCFGVGIPKKYDPVTTEEYVVRRLREAYGPPM